MTVPGRFWDKTRKTESSCWLWTGALHNGYGYFWWRGKVRLAHRVSYEVLVGPIPDGLQLDHLCRNPSCVNPDHLEPVTPQVNTLRSSAVTAVNARKTHCPKGHPLESGNLVTRKGNVRDCRTCAVAWTRAWRKRRGAI